MDEQSPTEKVKEIIESGAAAENMLVWAKLLHDKYLSYVAEGFTPEQAVYITSWEFFGVKAV